MHDNKVLAATGVKQRLIINTNERLSIDIRIQHNEINYSDNYVFFTSTMKLGNSHQDSFPSRYSIF